MEHLKFVLHDKVRMQISGETGVVVARAEYAERGPLYLVRYHDSYGRQVDTWCDEDGLTTAS